MTDEGWRGKVGVMEQDEIARFLEGLAIARLATVDAGGWPYVVPVRQEWSAGNSGSFPREVGVCYDMTGIRPTDQAPRLELLRELRSFRQRPSMGPQICASMDR